jgi:hypothetical protein
MDTVFIMKDAIHSNPYHLFYYMIGQLYASGMDKGEGRPVRYYYPPTDCILAEQAFSNLPARFIREFELRKDAQYIEPTFQSITEINRYDEQWIFKYIRGLYSHIWSQFKQIPGKYTYISRKKATCRRILNEGSYMDELESLGVNLYYMEDLSFIDQIRLFAESEIITGPHGAAYSFGAFCQPGTLLYEIYRADNIKGHYTILANECNLQYRRFYGIDAFDEITHDMTIDKESYIEELKILIIFRKLSGATS